MFKNIHVFRVMPGQELITEVTAYCKTNNITSGVILGIIGSVTSAKLNYIAKLPGEYKQKAYTGTMEIVGAQGTVAFKDNDLVLHIHGHLSNIEASFGGHIAEAIIFSTAEVVIGELDYQLNRVPDKYTGLNELMK
jgi:predicted DNA-binding protein with PD1-like motif